MAVHHDPAVAGTGRRSAICPPPSSPAYVPLLPEVLEACTGMTVNIEIKNLPGEPGYDRDERLAAAVAELVVADRPASSVVVSSFWPGPSFCPP